MKVVGYTFDAAIHCPDCTFAYAREVPYSEYVFGEYSDEDISDSPGIINVRRAIELEIIRDSENNPIHAVFDHDETDTPDHCDDCGTYIDTAFTEEAVNYVVEALERYITGEGGTAPVLDEWAEALHYCMKDSEDDKVLELYRRLRHTERKAEQRQRDRTQED